MVSLFRPWDHVWHKGIALSLPHVGEENFWGGPTYVHGKSYVQLDNNGTQHHREFTRLETSDRVAAIAHDLDWITESGTKCFTEHRAITARVLSPEAWMLTFETTLHNVSGHDIAIGSPTTKGRENAGYGGLFWRGPRSFTDGRLVTTNGSGSGNEMRGGRHEWMGFAGRHDHDDAASLVVMVDDAGNPCHPPQWFARSEEFACLNPAPFFSEELTVADGQTIRFRYGVGIADADADAAPELANSVRSELTDAALPSSA
ncbi:PmoA family protein [Glycomyces tritici]|uniref:PmoA family protein n=1 Tax=Glycomyces tritici TaxID=2665176 RepID=A0ABT7YKI8_9ACTN|nr:PmoA family protein [Glycomyces tritici]MDN3239139.1 PmoA family protein [Glycomyces tritici]